jgi:hypothetical protein
LDILGENDLPGRHQTGSNLVHPATHFKLSNDIGRLGVLSSF